ncbi:4'-phosphopantetheinyl transferase family protein [Planctomonas deserti]|uniref:4'-phosphopantetheinyl transferase family protein n=1 Tax=Planctomonas deserti TaxID=2144185 RepID=UPI000D3B5DE6|nr:4'-phosphopantetheinyl transferase superfamily protein [Planctomonas deserti]
MQWGSLTLAAVRLDAPAREDTRGGVTALHPVELDRAARMPSGRERDRFLGGRTALRRFAAGLLGTEPQHLLLDYACANCGLSGTVDHGRPGYRSPGGARQVRLSLSRSGPWALLAGTTDPAIGAVGVDLEDAGRAGFAGFDAVLLTPPERAALSRADTADEAGALRMRARLWARKEAFLKATGAGLFREPSDVDASGDAFEGVEFADIDPGQLGLPAELVLAAAVRRVP